MDTLATATASSAQEIWSQQEVDAYLDRPLLSGKEVFPGTRGLLLRDIEQDILKGGRFVIHHYCVSLAVVTLTRSSSVLYLRSWESGLGRACRFSLVSLLFGWWGVPFGLIMTPYTLWKNGRGGSDVTRDLLHQALGPARTQSLLEKAVPRQISPWHWLLLVVSLALPVGLIYAFIQSLD
ncbi:MAG: hypothetical protein V4672_08000 [Verrucomicrobiota bacterium]